MTELVRKILLIDFIIDLLGLGANHLNSSQSRAVIFAKVFLLAGWVLCLLVLVFGPGGWLA